MLRTPRTRFNLRCAFFDRALTLDVHFSISMFFLPNLGQIFVLVFVPIF
jgi:hypothetical protein